MNWNDRKLSGLNVDPDKTLMREKTEQGSFKSFKFKDNWATTWQNQHNECALSEESDQPSDLHIFAVHSMGS